MSAAKDNILKGLQENLQSLAQSRIVAGIQRAKAIKYATEKVEEDYQRELKSLDKRVEGVYEEIKVLESL